jgi:hypothetical protein
MNVTIYINASSASTRYVYCIFIGVKRPQPTAQIAHPPPVANRFVIRLGEDTDSDEESESSSPQKLPDDPLPK